MLRRFPALLRRFLGDRRGNIALLFSIAALPVTALTGAAVDYARASKEQIRLQSAADAAILAGVVASKTTLDGGFGRSKAIDAAENAASASFRANMGASTSANLAANFSINGLKISGTGTATESYKTVFMQAFGTQSTALSVTAQASSTAQPYMNVYLLIDISASMLLPATSDGITQMRNGTGCALACHDKTDGTDTYSWAIARNIQLRYQVVNQGIQNLITYLSSQSILKSHVKVELWAFDHSMTKLVSLTSSFSSITNNFPAPSLASTDASAATPFNSLIGTFVSSVGTGGDGSSFSNAQKLIILATDGVNDPTRGWTYDTSLRPQVQAFDTSFCTTLKSRNNIVAIINTPYFPMTWDWGYNATLGQPGSLGGATRVDDIPIALKGCAGTNFTVAADVATIQSAFVNLFTSLSPIRLTQ